MSFAVPQALEELIDEGIVYTYRKRRRKREGKNWINLGRGQPKIADVNITLEKVINVEHIKEQLEAYADKSGFQSLERWIHAIRVINDWHLGSDGYLYKVELLEPFPEFSHIEIIIHRNPMWLKPREMQRFFLSEQFTLGEYDLNETFKYHGEGNIEELWDFFDELMDEHYFKKREEE